MDKRKKASDIFQETNFLFSEKTTKFDRAFPGIEDINVDVEEDHNYSSHTRHYGKSSAGEYIDCHNPRCYGGGFSLGSLIRNMQETRAAEIETTEFCPGYEGSPKGRRNDGPCDNVFEIKIKIKYKDQTGSVSE